MQEDFVTERKEVTLSAEELYRAACRWGIGEVLNRLDLSSNGWEQAPDRLPAWVSDLTASSFRGCWMRYHLEEQAGEEFIHCCEEQVIFGERMGEASSSFKLCGEQVWESLCHAWAKKTCQSIRTEEDQADLPAMLLSRNEYDTLISRLKEMELDELMNRLAINSGDHEGSIALARSLKRPGSHGEILFYGRHSGCEKLELHQVRFVSTDHMNWILRESTGDREDWLIASPSSRHKFQEMLELWLMHSSSVEAPNECL
ncbi:hypothetical protein [Paenibacillus brevis]|uniref:Uncharacterized protein n=1 Tax=Paenibacillus brevis TaxID=2841508 RepID=A0ABS6FU70_9BACL|nr:hypothetical protein [Paenibacillus brevis]MBU5673466.1 hypothetical protein [Paenibacillus brevis]